jgi:hypothetical protein
MTCTPSNVVCLRYQATASLHILASVNTLPVLVQADAAAADLVPTIVVSVISLLVLLPVADG